MDWINTAQDSKMWQDFVNRVMNNLVALNVGNY